MYYSTMNSILRNKTSQDNITQYMQGGRERIMALKLIYTLFINNIRKAEFYMKVFWSGDKFLNHCLIPKSLSNTSSTVVNQCCKKLCAHVTFHLFIYF